MSVVHGVCSNCEAKNPRPTLYYFPEEWGDQPLCIYCGVAKALEFIYGKLG